MELSGWLIVALAALITGYLIPLKARNNRIKTDSWVHDPPSREIRIMDTSKPVKTHKRKPLPLIERNQEATVSNTRPGQAHSAATQNIQLEKARARLAAANAQHQGVLMRLKNLVLLLAAATAVTGVLSAFSVISWFITAPIALLAVAALLHTRKTAMVAARVSANQKRRISALERKIQARTGAPQRPSAARRAVSGGTAGGAAGGGLKREVLRDGAAASPAEGMGAETAGVFESPGAGAGAGADAGVEGAAGAQGVEAGGAVVSDGVVGDRVSVDVENGSVFGAETGGAADARRVAVGEPWTPTALPTPTYQIKAKAPRREVSQYEADPDYLIVDTGAPVDAGVEIQRETQMALGVDTLADVLERRRASGE